MSRSLVALLGLSVLVSAAAWAATQETLSGDLIANRKRLMRLNGASVADLQAKLKAGAVEAIAVNAETIAVNALHIPLLFPASTLSGDTRAKPEIEQRRDEFRANAAKLQGAAEQLRDAARAKDGDRVRTVSQELTQACADCHTTFRR